MFNRVIRYLLSMKRILVFPNGINAFIVNPSEFDDIFLKQIKGLHYQDSFFPDAI